MSKISTIPGLAQLPIKKSLLKTARSFLEARRRIDGAEELWRINNKLYDLEMFMKTHPGGADWIRLTKGTDITELFEVWKQKQNYSFYNDHYLIFYETYMKSFMYKVCAL
jgi:hypothetical protein